MEPQEIRKRYPELSPYSDDELRQIQQEVETLAKIILRLIHTRPDGSKGDALGLLQGTGREE